MFVCRPTPNSYAEALTPNVVVFENMDFGR